MNTKAEDESPAKLLSRRESELVPRSISTDETVNISVVKNEMINLRRVTFENEQSSRKPSQIPDFEPLDEDGERYLQECMRLPPIDLTETPTRYYINPHPTESIFSSGPNSVTEWWDKVDYSDSEDIGEIECPSPGPRMVHQVRRYTEKTKDMVGNPPENPVERTFPKTLEMRRERRIRELQEEETSRADIISKLEKKMVSLYNLKRQYRRTLVGKGCPGARATSLPPLSVAAGDSLARQRDSLLLKIKRKKMEDEKNRKLCIERKIEIVKMLLEEQKQKEKQLKNKIKEATRFAPAKEKKPKKEPRMVSLEEVLETLDVLEKSEVIEDKPPAEDAVAEVTGVVQETIEPPLSPSDDVPPSPDQLDTPAPSPRKKSKGKGGKNKKSSEVPDIQDGKMKKGKKEKGKKEKGATETEETPAICEPPPELPASQMAELPLWFKNWREDNITKPDQWNKYIEAQQLPEEIEVTVKPRTLVFKNVAAGRKVQQTVVITNKGQETLQCRVNAVDQPSGALLQTVMSGPSKARAGQSWSLAVVLVPWEGVEDGTATVLLTCCRGEVRTRLSITVQLLTCCRR